MVVKPQTSTKGTKMLHKLRGMRNHCEQEDITQTRDGPRRVRTNLSKEKILNKHITARFRE